jgi:hypothetical protein
MMAAYLRERFTLRVFLPLALFIGLATATPSQGWEMLVLDSAYALLLVLQFRVWDDLADRSRDAVSHPDRVLVRAPEVTPIIALCGALAVLNICLAVWRDATGLAVSLLALLNLALGAWYFSRSHRRSSPVDPTRLVIFLAKYPAILIIVAGARLASHPLQTLSAALLLYVVVCAYEAWHDPKSPLARSLSPGGH